jgi:hypothetical protein
LQPSSVPAQANTKTSQNIQGNSNTRASLMKVGDLVRYVSLYERDGGEFSPPINQDCGIVLAVNGGEDGGYYTVLWFDGLRQDDLVDSELEVLSESR